MMCRRRWTGLVRSGAVNTDSPRPQAGARHMSAWDREVALLSDYFEIAVSLPPEDVTTEVEPEQE